RDLAADGHALAQLELRDGLARAGDVRPLAGDNRELVHGLVEGPGVRLRLADAHAERDLLEARVLHRRAVAELLLQLRADLALVGLPEPRRRGGGRGVRGRRRRLVGHQARFSPEGPAPRTFRPSTSWTRTRVGRPSLGSIRATF